MTGTRQLAAALREEGGLLADALSSQQPADEALLAGVPGGPHALALSAVREAYLLHYGGGRVVDTDDADLALLGGDRLYALALAELAALGDLPTIAVLAELISDCARAHADDASAEATVAWERAVSAVVRNRTR
ncbi:MAG TPA: hypothetical protein VFS37_09960 [Conexibacter sp.]|nr:hypothetical protein [Conexibacter sp.]